MTSLQLRNVDFQQSRNAVTHRTIDYDTAEPVLRRGQGFSIILNFNRSVQSGDGFTIIAETGSRPTESGNTRVVMPLSSSTNSTRWSAVRGPSSGNSLTVTINPPVTAVIGRYQLSLQITSGGRTSTAKGGTFVMLFNCWASGDEVFLNNEAERVEYVLNEGGMYWFGNANRFDSRRWDYAQFESGILDTCLILLDKSSFYASNQAEDVARRNDPLHVGRVLSALVNSNDNDQGVIVGNWSGNYAGGESPTYWNGSASILRQWRQSGPVKYGQCWVYAGVLCTVLRCFGIPARVIINFESAHDTDMNLIVDNYYDENGKKDNYRTSDSKWNFHAWDEIWSKRKDIGAFYDGWQVLDSTPQEPSGGIFRLGPCSLNAVREGHVDLPYDAPFVFAEVNADTYNWVVYPDGTQRKIYSEPAAVGWYTSTKAVGSFTRVDVTGNYKYPEGSTKEREAFSTAQSRMRAAAAGPAGARMHMASMSLRDAQPEEAAVKPEFSGAFTNKETQVGEDLNMDLTLKSSASNTRTVMIKMTSTAIIYNSTPVGEISTDSQSVSLVAKGEKTISFKITYNQYSKRITPDNMIEIVAVCVDETGGRLLISKVVTLKNPPLLIRPTEEPRLNKPTNVDIIFSNPINDVVDDSVLTIEGSSLLKEPIVVKVPGLKKNQRATVEVQVHPSRVGEKSILVDFTSKKFPNVKGFQSVVVPRC
ncbi:hypothetical protein GDO81_012869 [Engystomops pustulosus]|uniref:protein-glutamine gamma-glutamyltransferase n=2 Tax=Engystomops pustulosus TaxID=76066 RepID=A0AAV7AV89_ENGPU|nr:hypothetical protein GDO81_012869 [Engystomops pustulosus]